MWDVALSTIWAMGRFRDLRGFFPAARELGFWRFELNHQVDSTMLRSAGLNGGPFNGTISSVHEPCPADISMAELNSRDWLISSTDEGARRQGLRVVQRSIDLAQELGASLVVVHAGRVDVDTRLEGELWALWEAGRADSPRYLELKDHLVAARTRRAEANLDAVRRSVRELAEYAGRAGICLGLENRYHFLDIPFIDEMEHLLSLHGVDHVGFLYDVGHAQTLENLGFCAHEDWLRRYAPGMVGVHLHDIRGLVDHVASGLGEVDWDMVARYLPAGALRTCEFRHYNTPDQVVAALHFLAGKGCIGGSEGS